MRKHLQVYTVAELADDHPETGIQWIIFRPQKRTIAECRVDGFEWHAGYFWGCFEGQRQMPSVSPADLVHVFKLPKKEQA